MRDVETGSPLRTLHWIDALAACKEPVVTVAVARAEGSTPREAGARMLVTGSSIEGTIGGGHLEFQAVARARELLQSGADPGRALRYPGRMVRFALGPSLGQCCGGAASLVLERFEQPLPGWIVEAAGRRASGETLVLATPVEADSAAPATSGAGGGGRGYPVREMPRLIGRREAGCVAGVDGAPAMLREQVRALIESVDAAACLVSTPEGMVLLERIAPDAFHVTLFGAGHVGQALAASLGLLPCRVTWVDDRDGQFPATIPANVSVVTSAAPPLEVAQAPTGSFFLVMTHSHAIDQDICEEILRRDDFAYCGLIGSGTKRAMFERRLAQRGIPRERLSRLTCPIGIPGIRGKEPAVIAAAVVAQLLQVREAALAGPVGAISAAAL